MLAPITTACSPIVRTAPPLPGPGMAQRFRPRTNEPPGESLSSWCSGQPLGPVELAVPQPVRDAAEPPREVAAVGAEGKAEYFGGGLLGGRRAQVGALQRTREFRLAGVGAQRGDCLLEQVS